MADTQPNTQSGSQSTDPIEEAAKRPDYMKAVNTTFTPPEVDLKLPDEDITDKPPLPEVVPVDPNHPGQAPPHPYANPNSPP
jgi:hypothetical protein